MIYKLKCYLMMFKVTKTENYIRFQSWQKLKYNVIKVIINNLKYSSWQELKCYVMVFKLTKTEKSNVMISKLTKLTSFIEIQDKNWNIVKKSNLTKTSIIYLKIYNRKKLKQFMDIQADKTEIVKDIQVNKTETIYGYPIWQNWNS